MNPQCNVLHVISGLSIGGAEMMLYKLLSATSSEPPYPSQRATDTTPRSESSVRSAVLSLSDGGELVPDIRKLGVPLYQLPMPGGFPSPGFGGAFRRIIREVQPDVVAAWMYRANAVASVLTPPEIPVVWHVRQSLDHNSSQRLLFRFTRRVNRVLARSETRAPALVIYNSRTSREQHHRFGLGSLPDQVIPNGFDMDRFRPDPEARASVRRAWNVGDEEVVFGIVGRHHPIKDHLGFVRATGRVKSPIRCVMVGRGLDENNRGLIGEIEAHGLGDRVTLLGEQRDLPRIYNGFDVMVSSSLVEAFPNVLGEAMSCGLPCIATAVGDSAWVIDDTGLTVPAGDPDALAKAMQQAAAWTAEERQRRGAAARNRVQANFGIAAVAGEFVRAYRHLTKDMIRG